MRNIGFICRRELVAYFASPLAYVFIVFFVSLIGVSLFINTAVVELKKGS